MASFRGAAQDIPVVNVEAGWILEARADGDFGAKETLPRFFRLHVPAIQVPVAQARVHPWVRSVGFNNVTHDEPTDTYTLDLEADNASATKGRITQTEALPLVELIGGTIEGDTTNGVSIAVPVQNLILRWMLHERQNIPISSFTHVSHVAGVHTFDFAYGGLVGHTAVAKHVMILGGEVIAQDVINSTLRLSMEGESALNAAKVYLKGKLITEILKASWSLTSSALTTILANGGEMEVTQAQLFNNIEDLRL